MTQPDLARLAVSARADEMQRRLVEGTFYSDDYDQASADLRIIPELLARIAALESVDKAARAYANAYLVDEAADPELTGCPPEQNAAAVALFDALEFAKESTDGR